MVQLLPSLLQAYICFLIITRAAQTWRKWFARWSLKNCFKLRRWPLLRSASSFMIASSRFASLHYNALSWETLFDPCTVANIFRIIRKFGIIFDFSGLNDSLNYPLQMNQSRISQLLANMFMDIYNCKHFTKSFQITI